jgi:uroporphyrinogen decarboxylase
MRECYFPALAQAVHDIHALGLVVFFHSDGNLNSILADLAECELDGIQGLEPAAGMSLSSARERVGDKLTLWGNLSFGFLSETRSAEEIESALRALTNASGKLIVGSCGGLVDGMNVETVRRVYRYSV